MMAKADTIRIAALRAALIQIHEDAEDFVDNKIFRQDVLDVTAEALREDDDGA